MKHGLAAITDIYSKLPTDECILIASDFDGTLCPIANSPAAVQLDHAMLEILGTISHSLHIRLAVISGRALRDLAARIPFSIPLSGNHGLEIASSGSIFEHFGAVARRGALSRVCQKLRCVTGVCNGAWVENKGLSATLHFRNVDLADRSSVVAAAERSLEPEANDFEIRLGNQILEIIPRVEWNKGRALNYIKQRLGPFAACICLGDDRTDEAMFLANAGQINITVGPAQLTGATHCLSDHTEVLRFLTRLDSLRPTSVPSHFAQMTASSEP